ncbi:MAG: protein-L-isoaspartate(D-aspartate) O-methyltransferase [Prevotellaceae bacterium]|jgi:protein-L-isoaspartate(D-aspartate) O-methyltransferase|nr:protein-L-isoaspartate(D-aspartate) O-methyltransferase [Prevotellaceae bacterium]
MQDKLIHKGQRKKMIDELRRLYPFDERVLAAMADVPRHLFVEPALAPFAYSNKPLSIAAGQTISQPYTVAMQTHLLQVRKWDKTLEIGTGCGYQAAVLVTMGALVYTVERQKELYLQAQRTFLALGLEAIFSYGDGYAGKPLLAPFDRIIVTCGAPEIPPALTSQLAVGGRMVIPVGNDRQTMTVVERRADNTLRVTEHGSYRFVPMLEGKNTGAPL